MLRKLIELLRNIDPAQVKELVAFITALIGVFGAQGFQAKGTADSEEEKECVEALKTKGIDEAEAKKVVRSLNA